MSELVTHFFSGISMQVSIGIHDAEKAGPQRLLVDLDYDVTEPVEWTDTLASVHNYDEVLDAVERIAASRHFNLQETLCREIMTTLLGRPEIVRARVSSRKPDIYKDVDAVGVIMERRKLGTEHEP